MSDTLEERLKTHSSAFDGLLSLIPAKYYYDDATQDQWQQKKKSKKEIQDLKRAKLDPESSTQADEYNTAGASAKDVMDNKFQVATVVKSLPTEKSQDPMVIDEKEQVKETSYDIESEQENANQNDATLFDDDGNAISSSNGATTKSLQNEMIYKKSNKKEKSEEEQKKKQEKLRDLRKKLAKKITDLREKRKAPGTKTPGAPKSREQILEERRKKEDAKKLEKLKRKQEEMENVLSESDSEMEDLNEANKESNVLFGNIVFDDGTRVTSDLSGVRSTADKRKQKGPANNDIKAHLSKLEQKKKRIDQMDPEERIKQLEKDKWQKVITQADGVKLKDDEKLLKKALKRKEKQKLKSEIAWKERKQIVKDTAVARSKRREENLKARRDNKGKKGKKQPKLKKFTGIAKPSNKKRAGFEGSAKSKGKAKKSN